MKAPKTIDFNNEELEVLGGHRVRGEQYWVVGKYGRPPRQSERVLLELSKKRFKERVIHRFDDDKLSWERIERIERFQGTKMPFPDIKAIQRQSGEILTVRDHISGRSLRWHLKMGKEISAFQAIRLYNQLVSQICFLFRKTGILHGDLAPENLIVSSSQTSLVLIDFGSSFLFSKASCPDIGDGARNVYRAPENLAGLPPSRQSEQFAAASIFYEMLTLKTPYYVAEKKDVVKFGRALPKASNQPKADKRLPPLLWSLIDEHFSKALALEPKKRFLTIGDWQKSAQEMQEKSMRPELLELDRNGESIFRNFTNWLRR